MYVYVFNMHVYVFNIHVYVFNTYQQSVHTPSQRVTCTYMYRSCPCLDVLVLSAIMQIQGLTRSEPHPKGTASRIPSSRGSGRSLVVRRVVGHLSRVQAITWIHVYYTFTTLPPPIPSHHPYRHRNIFAPTTST